MQIRVTSQHRLATEYIRGRGKTKGRKREKKKKKKRRRNKQEKNIRTRRRVWKIRRSRGSVCEAGITPMATRTARWHAVISFPPASWRMYKHAYTPGLLCVSGSTQPRRMAAPRECKNYSCQPVVAREPPPRDKQRGNKIGWPRCWRRWYCWDQQRLPTSPKAKQRGTLVTAPACRYRRCILNERQIVAVGWRGREVYRGKKEQGYSGGHSSPAAAGTRFQSKKYGNVSPAWIRERARRLFNIYERSI